MPIAVVGLTQGNSTVDAGSFLTASVTPTADRWVFVHVDWANAVNAQASPLSGVTGCGLTWHLLAGQNYGAATGRRRHEVWYSMGPAPTTGQIQTTFGETATAYCWSAGEVSGTDTSGTAGAGAIVQSATNRATTGATLTVNLAPFGSPANATLGFFVGVGSSGDMLPTPTGGFVDLTHQTVASGTTISLLTEYKLGADQTVDAAQSTANDSGGIAVEIKAAALQATLDRATEAGSPQDLGRRKALALFGATGAGTSQSFGQVKEAALTSAGEAGTAQTIGRSKSLAAARAAEADEARAAGQQKVLAVAEAAEAGSPQAFGRVKAQAPSVALEAGLPAALGLRKLAAVDRATEASAAQDLVGSVLMGVPGTVEVGAEGLGRVDLSARWQSVELDVESHGSVELAS